MGVRTRIYTCEDTLDLCGVGDNTKRNGHQVGVIINKVTGGAVGVELGDEVVVRGSVEEEFPDSLGHGAAEAAQRGGKLSVHLHVIIEIGDFLQKQDQHAIAVGSIILPDDHINPQRAGGVKQPFLLVKKGQYVARGQVYKGKHRVCERAVLGEGDIPQHRKGPEDVRSQLFRASDGLISGHEGDIVVHELASAGVYLLVVAHGGVVEALRRIQWMLAASHRHISCAFTQPFLLSRLFLRSQRTVAVKLYLVGAKSAHRLSSPL
mmetsp:Transcript_10402/g.18109  ORF Transcript_10402/g.18109 Transcript_10402/m.18109 type:complete len:264 (-) Transcript_10402:1178-1969(-)